MRAIWIGLGQFGWQLRPLAPRLYRKPGCNDRANIGAQTSTCRYKHDVEQREREQAAAGFVTDM